MMKCACTTRAVRTSRADSPTGRCRRGSRAVQRPA
jgi:hypothetical protein